MREKGWDFTEKRVVRSYGENGGTKSWWGGKFITTDGDSFGPLVRILFGATSPDGKEVDIWHG